MNKHDPKDWSLTKDIKDQIRLVPEIKTLVAMGIGVWECLEIEFGPGLNLITGRGGTGKTTILKAIVAAFSGLIDEGYLKQHEESKVLVTPWASGICVSPSTGDIFIYPLNYDSASNRLAQMLSWVVTRSPKGCALLMDDLLDRMDDEDYARSLEKLVRSGRQVIAISKRATDTPGVKVFECVHDRRANCCRISTIKDDKG